MVVSWKLSACAPRAVIEAALAKLDEAPDWDGEIIVGGSEIAEDRPEDWRLDAWLSREPTESDLAALRGLFASDPPTFALEPLPETDWVAASQAGLEPIVAGRFRVRTPDHPAEEAENRRELVIPASLAFGTGQHETTSGCLTMLTMMADRGIAAANFIDVGTGTGLLAFAARELWPRGIGTASDIDPVCAEIVRENAERNAIPLGNAPGELALVIADGLDHPALRERAPFDLLIANILAGPLIELAPAFAAALSPGGHVVLAGLLTGQAAAVEEAYERVGLTLVERLERGGWAILWLRRRSEG